MPRRKPSRKDLTELRRRAEDRLRKRKDRARVSPRDAVDERRLLHELEVHQVELEMQNEELRASRLEAERTAARYAELHDFAPVGYATLDGGGKVLAVNFAGAALLGLERSRLTGRRLADLVRECDRVGFAAFIERALVRGGEGRESCELGLDGRKGIVRALLTATALTRPEPEILLAIQDVTERVKWEKDREEALRLLEVSQRIAMLGTFTIDVSTGVWTSSTVLDEILGVDRRFERMSPSFIELAHPDDREALATYLGSGVREGEKLDREFRIVRPQDGEVRWVWSHVELDAANPIRLVGTIQDLTERRRLQQERDELLRLAQAARSDAEEASRSKDSFMATLSHELRNPLAPISNSLHVLERSEPGSEQGRHALRVIGRQVHHLAALVDDLLDTTRIARGKIHLRCESIDLDDLAARVVEDHRSLFDGNEVRLDLSRAPAPILVMGDWNRLAQVVGNLLQNAAKFCRAGGRTEMTVSRDSRERQAVLRVADDGVGMAPEMLSRLFQPFSQADATLERSKGGLGLGMALAKTLVELHGGQVHAYSAGIGKGSEFEVRLPLATETGDDARPGAPPRRAAGGPRRVLIIEDNADAADTLREVLEMHLHQVTVAHSGPEGLVKARVFRPDVVLCDIGLPGLDGYEVAKAIRADEALRDTYLVALSGYARPDDVRRAEESGFHRHVAKPPDPEEIERLVAEAAPVTHPLAATLSRA